MINQDIDRKGMLEDIHLMYNKAITYYMSLSFDRHNSYILGEILIFLDDLRILETNLRQELNYYVQ